MSTTRSVNSGANTDNRTDSLNDTDILSVSRFDSTLGTLDSITLSFFSMSINSAASANFRDDDSFNETSGLQRLQNMRISTSGSGFAFSRSRSNRTSTCSNTSGIGAASCSTSLGSLTNSFGSASFSNTSGIGAASCSTSLGSLTNSFGSASFNVVTPSLLDPYIGDGNVNITISQFGQLFTSETDGDDGYVNSRFGRVSSTGRLNITYFYTPTPIPIPAAVWLFAGGLGILALMRRRV